MQPIDTLRNLMLMASADGQVTSEELELLEARRVAWGISREQFQEALREADSVDARLILTADRHQRHDFLRDMIEVMAADGRLDQMEIQLFALVAARLDISQTELDELLAEFSDEDDLILGDEG